MVRIGNKGYFFPTLEIKDYNIMIDKKNIFGQQVKSDLKPYDNIKELRQLKEMITQLVVYLAIFIVKNIVR